MNETCIKALIMFASQQNLILIKFSKKRYILYQMINKPLPYLHHFWSIFVKFHSREVLRLNKNINVWFYLEVLVYKWINTFYASDNALLFRKLKRSHINALKLPADEAYLRFQCISQSLGHNETLQKFLMSRYITMHIFPYRTHKQ